MKCVQTAERHQISNLEYTNKKIRLGLLTNSYPNRLLLYLIDSITNQLLP